MPLKHLFTIIVASLLLSITMIRSGRPSQFGYGYWGPNGHDAIWHLAVIRQSQSNIPPKNPIFSGQVLNNYHWGFDLVAALIANLTVIDLQTIYFQILPIITAFFYGLFSYLFFRQLTGNQTASLIFVLLNFFAGSLGWIVSLARTGSLGGESLFWSMQGVSTLLNPPFSLSLVLLFWGLWLMLMRTNPILVGVILGLLALIKVYASILVGLSLVAFIISKVNKPNFAEKYYLQLFACFSILSAIIFFLFGYSNSGSLILWQPFWVVHSLVESTDKLYWPQLASYRQSLSQNLSLIKLPLFIAIEATLTAIFLFGNFGTRIFGLIFTKIKLETSVIIKTATLLSILFPLFFIQKGTAWNTIQFLYYGLIFSNIYLAVFLSQLIKDRRYVLFIAILIATILTSFGTLRDYFGSPPPASLPPAEIKALSFLGQQPGEIVLTFPYDPYSKTNLATPLPLRLYETTAYLPAFSGKISYLSDEMNASILGLDWQQRRKSSLDFFTTQNRHQARGFLLNNKIDYIYLVGQQNFQLSPPELEIDQIYSFNNVRIFHVRK